MQTITIPAPNPAPEPVRYNNVTTIIPAPRPAPATIVYGNLAYTFMPPAGPARNQNPPTDSGNVIIPVTTGARLTGPTDHGCVAMPLRN